MTVDKRLISLLVCPLCKGKLDYRPDAEELICLAERLAYPIRDGVPVMLATEARQLTSEEKPD